MTCEQPRRAAIIGLGNIGFRFDLQSRRQGTWSHAAAYTRSPETELVGAVELDGNKADLFRKHYPAVPVYDDIGRLMTACRPEIVSICTPTESHYPLLKELLVYPLRGVFCEKPLAANAAEGLEMVRAAAAHGIVLAVNHTRRWDPGFLRVQELVRRGELGAIRAVHAVYPGQVFNIGTHLMDVVCMITGRAPVCVSGVALPGGGDDPHLSGWLRLDDGTVCTINALGRRELLVFELDFIGARGRVRISDNGESLEGAAFVHSDQYDGYEVLRRRELPAPPERDRLVEAVTDMAMVIGGRKDKVNCTGADGLVALRLAAALAASARRHGRPVAVEG